MSNEEETIRANADFALKTGPHGHSFWDCCSGCASSGKISAQTGSFSMNSKAGMMMERTLRGMFYSASLPDPQRFLQVQSSRHTSPSPSQPQKDPHLTYCLSLSAVCLAADFWASIQSDTSFRHCLWHSPLECGRSSVAVPLIDLDGPDPGS